MIAVEQEIRAALIAALPSGTPVVFGALPSPQFPSVVLNTIAEMAEITHSGESALRDCLLQVDCYALTYTAAGELWRQVSEVLLPPLAMLRVARRGRETGANEASRPFRVSADYQVLHAIEP